MSELIELPYGNGKALALEFIKNYSEVQLDVEMKCKQCRKACFVNFRYSGRCEDCLFEHSKDCPEYNVVETVSKAKTAGIMSVEACVEEMYGDSKEQSWKDEEIARLKVEQGVITPDDDGITTDLGDFSVNVNG